MNQDPLKTRRLPSIIAFLASLLIALTTTMAGRKGAVATVDQIATESAKKAMSVGGNAIDGAIAAGLTLGVVNGYNSGIGGGCFLILRLADGQRIAIDGREMAPAAAHRDMFLKQGLPQINASTVGALASGVPGALAAYHYACQRYGKLPFSQHLQNAAAIADEGFPIPPEYARRLSTHADVIRQFPSSAAILLTKEGQPKTAHSVLRQPDLAKTYRQIAEEGTAWFYGGPFAEKTAQWMARNGGVLSVEDFKNYQIKVRHPIETTYRGLQIIGMPPPSSGGIHVAQMLNMLESSKLNRLAQNSADMIHRVAETMKLAFADRAHWLGDSDYAQVPRGLIDKRYARKLSARIDMAKTIEVKEYGIPPEAYSNLFNKHTTHFATADQLGNWVACTATINTTFGSKVIIPGTGVIMNNEMDDFCMAPGVPNAYGLVGAEANAIEPGKRPLSSMSPTIVLKDGKPILSIGAAGGPTIITQALLGLIHSLDYEKDVTEALAQPRFHHQWKPDVLRIEKGLPEEVYTELTRRGHELFMIEQMGATQAIEFRNQAFRAASDPRLQGKAVTF